MSSSCQVNEGIMLMCVTVNDIILRLIEWLHHTTETEVSYIIIVYYWTLKEREVKKQGKRQAVGLYYLLKDFIIVLLLVY